MRRARLWPFQWCRMSGTSHGCEIENNLWRCYTLSAPTLVGGNRHIFCGPCFDWNNKHSRRISSVSKYSRRRHIAAFDEHPFFFGDADLWPAHVLESQKDPIVSLPKYKTLTDQELVSLCLKGDGHAWEALIVRYRRLIYSIPVRFNFSSAA